MLYTAALLYCIVFWSVTPGWFALSFPVWNPRPVSEAQTAAILPYFFHLLSYQRLRLLLHPPYFTLQLCLYIMTVLGFPQSSITSSYCIFSVHLSASPFQVGSWFKEIAPIIIKLWNFIKFLYYITVGTVNWDLPHWILATTRGTPQANIDLEDRGVTRRRGPAIYITLGEYTPALMSGAPNRRLCIYRDHGFYSVLIDPVPVASEQHHLVDRFSGRIIQYNSISKNGDNPYSKRSTVQWRDPLTSRSAVSCIRSPRLPAGPLYDVNGTSGVTLHMKCLHIYCVS